MHQRKPEWLKIKLDNVSEVNSVKKMLNRLSLNTVCKEANCPNMLECFGKRTATFMILGKNCSRNCTFCNVTKGQMEKVDPNEPKHIAEAVTELKLKHIVITSVTRDDLPDGGSEQFKKVVEEIRKVDKNVTIELLVPDFQGKENALETVVKAKPNILNHNIETVPRLYSGVRPKADYLYSLEVLKNVKKIDQDVITKSGIMLGLGEEEEEVIAVFKDLREYECDMLTVGQYLAPSSKHHPVIAYITPEQFKKYEKIAYDLGFKYVSSGPLVRSSYHAGEAIDKVE